jgi:acetyl-CoA acetyltransferase
MDQHRYKILVTFVFFMVIQHVTIIVVPLQQLAFYQHYSAMMMMAAFIMKTNGTTRERFNNFWATIQQL